MAFLKIFSTEWLTKLVSTTEFGAKTKTKYQKKQNAGNVTAVGVISALSFNNVEAGKLYRLTGWVRSTSGTNEDPESTIRNTDNSIIAYVSHQTTITGTLVLNTSISVIFTAVGNGSINFSKESATGTISDNTYLILEELPFNEATVQWT